MPAECSRSKALRLEYRSGQLADRASENHPPAGEPQHVEKPVPSDNRAVLDHTTAPILVDGASLAVAAAGPAGDDGLALLVYDEQDREKRIPLFIDEEPPVSFSGALFIAVPPSQRREFVVMDITIPRPGVVVITLTHNDNSAERTFHY